MNEDKLKKGIKGINNIRMSENERMKIFNNISFHIDKSHEKMQPLKASGGRMTKDYKPSPYFDLFSVFTRRSLATAFVIVLIFGGIGSLTAFAEKALPGDLLYAIKVNINESIRDKTLVGQNAKINWEAEKVDRRLEEAETLAEKGLLDDTSRKGIEDMILKHSEKFDEFTEAEDEKIKKDKSISEIKIVESSKIKVNFDENIDKHAKNLEKIEEKLSNGEKEEVKTLRKNLLEKVKNRKEENKKNESDSNTVKNETDKSENDKNEID